MKPRRIIQTAMAMIVAIASVALVVQPASASPARSVVKTAPAKPGWTTTRTATGTLSVSPMHRYVPQGQEFRVSAAVSSCSGTHPEECLSLGRQTPTGASHYFVPPGGYCPCYYEPIYYRTFTVCNDYEMYAVVLCSNGEIRYAVAYAACVTRCSSALYRGYHNCGTSGTGAAGFSIDTTDCSDTYLSSRPPISRGSEVRYGAKLCFFKYSVCDYVAYHLNTYPSGTITGPWDGEGPYE